MGVGVGVLCALQIKAAATALPTQVIGNVTSAATLVASLSTVYQDTGESSGKESDSLSFSDSIIDLNNVVAIALPAVISVAIGSRLGSRLSESALKLLFGVTLAGIAPLILHKTYKDTFVLTNSNSSICSGDVGELTTAPTAISTATIAEGVPAEISPTRKTTSILNHLQDRGELALAGTAMGFLTGLVGVGGGPIIISYLSLQTHREFTPRQVVGTANLAMLPMMVMGTATHALQGNIVWRAAAPLCLATMTGGFLGGLAAAYAPVQILQTALAGFLLVTGYSTSSKAIRVLLRR